MRCLLPLLLTIVVTLSVVAAPIPPDDAGAKLKRIYGTWESPKGCSWKFSGEELHISLPADRYGMEAKGNGPTGVARVLREVEGDFTAVVRVAFPNPADVSKASRMDFHGGGLMALATEQDYVVARRAVVTQTMPHETFMSLNHTGSIDTCSVTFIAQSTQAKRGFIRLKREGQTVTTEFTIDQKEWRSIQPKIQVKWGPKVKVGIVAENVFGAPVDITFDEFKLTLVETATKP